MLSHTHTKGANRYLNTGRTELKTKEIQKYGIKNTYTKQIHRVVNYVASA